MQFRRIKPESPLFPGSLSKSLSGLLLSGVLALSVSPAIAQDDDDPAVACRAAAELYEDNEIGEALEEARWCVEALEQLKSQLVTQLFPDEVNGFTGGQISSEGMMGMKITERTYTREGDTIEVSMMSGGLAAGGLAALAQLGMGMEGIGKKMRIQRQTVFEVSDGSEAQFNIQLKDKGMLQFTSQDVSREDVIAFMEGFPLKKLVEASDQ